MRLYYLPFLLSSIFAPGGFWFKGCSQDVESEPEQKIVANQPKEENATGTSAQTETSTSSEYTDPLVPPIMIEPGVAQRWKEQIGNPKLLFDESFEEHDFTSDLTAHFHAHGQEVCASGCAASRHPTPELTKEEFERLIVDFALEPMNSSSPALEALLYYGRQTDRMLQKYGTHPLDENRVSFLKSELKKTHAYISFRLLDEHGVVRTEMKRTRVPLDRRHEFEMEVHRLPDLQTSGTVKRVGLHHLWTRI